jgi:hypothetical protein
LRVRGGGELEHRLLGFLAVKLLQQQLFGPAPRCEVLRSGLCVRSRSERPSFIEEIFESGTQMGFRDSNCVVFLEGTMQERQSECRIRTANQSYGGMVDQPLGFGDVPSHVHGGPDEPATEYRVPLTG